MEKKFRFGLLTLERKLHNELEGVLKEEEVLWFQKSREKWISLGDRNKRFFHVTTIVRRNRNKINQLMNEDGCWVSDPTTLKNMTVSYFKHLFSLDDNSGEDCSILATFPPSNGEEFESLKRPFMLMRSSKLYSIWVRTKLQVLMGTNQYSSNGYGIWWVRKWLKQRSNVLMKELFPLKWMKHWSCSFRKSFHQYLWDSFGQSAFVMYLIKSLPRP